MRRTLLGCACLLPLPGDHCSRRSGHYTLVVRMSSIFLTLRVVIRTHAHAHVRPALQESQEHLPEGYKASNVMVTSWVPQTAVLGHPAVKGFLCHGGHTTTNEALATGTPMLCMPFGGDQLVVAQHIKDHGYGLQVGRRTGNRPFRDLCWQGWWLPVCGGVAVRQDEPAALMSRCSCWPACSWV